MRLFISIPVSGDLQNKIMHKLAPARKKLEGYNIRYQSPAKWHFTIIFLGDQSEDATTSIIECMDSATQSIERPDIAITDIKYGPPRKAPSMIRATTDKRTSQRLGSMREYLRGELEKAGIIWKKSGWSYKGHITLARFKIKNSDTLPHINTTMDLCYIPSNICLMKSELNPDGARYSVIKQWTF